MSIFVNYITPEELKEEVITNPKKISDGEITQAIKWASFRINTLSGNMINKLILVNDAIDWTKIKPEQKTLVQQATVFYTHHFLTYGMAWMRGSFSSSMGYTNLSQSNPEEPDYVPKQVTEALIEAGFFNYYHTFNMDLNRKGGY